MQDIIIGKHTLESLTTGMYSDPFVIYREYIQNATDSIDAAYKTGILCKGEEQIDVIIYFAEKRIVIKDNGLGIRASEVATHLLSIGNSHKVSTTTRGFRGIGRLSGLGYCTNLTFETSAQGDITGTRITIDSSKLSDLLANDQYNAATILDVLNNIYSIETYPEKENSHYFSVIMEGVEDSVKLTNYNEVIAYLSQNVPVSYDPEKFTWGREIISRLSQKGYNIESYKVFLTYQNKCEPVYKPYANSFLIDKTKNTIDNIADVQIFSFTNSDKKLLAVGWVAKTSFLGSIYDRNIKGIRIRKGNILIGDNQTLNVIFKDARFNGWSLGEIFALDSKLIPNARRDNFEKNSTYFIFIEKLTMLASSMTKEIRNTSLKRNETLSAALEEAAKVTESAKIVLDDDGLTVSQKSSLKNKLSKVHNKINQATINDDADALYQEIAFEELDMLIGSIQGLTSFKALNSIKHVSVVEKKVLEKVIKILIEYNRETSNDLIDYILMKFH